MPRTIPLARFIFARLAQHNVHAIHGVPGDMTLKALDHVTPAGLKWIGSCNELNAGYAADGYARIRGLAAVFTTYGVGELSALNAVAASYAEQVPVVHMVGSPSRKSLAEAARRGNVHLHHSLGDGRTGVYREIAAKVTCAQGYLGEVPRSAPDVVDKVIHQCLKWHLPVYIDLPCDMVDMEVDIERLQDSLNLKDGTDDEVMVSSQADKLLAEIYAAKQPLILVDRGGGMATMKDEVNELVRKSRIPCLAMPSGAGLVDNFEVPNYFGLHSGPVGQIDTMPYVTSSDLVLAFGPLFSDTQTLGWSIVPESEKTLTINKNSIGNIEINSAAVLRRLSKQLDPNRIQHRNEASLGDFRAVLPSSAAASEPINQKDLYIRLSTSDYFQPDDVILLGNGTPLIGGRDFVLPPRALVIASGMAFSIGHMLPAAQGAAVAQTRGRTILLDGDGSFQVTVQELSTIIRARLDMVIFIINNGGYAYERHIHGMHELYNDIAPWNYLDAPRFFGAASDYPVEAHRVETWGDLDRLLESDSFRNGKGLKMVDIVVGKFDVPEKFKQIFRTAGDLL